MKGAAGPPPRASRLEAAAVAGLCGAFVHLLTFSQGTYVYGRDPVAGSLLLDEPLRVLDGDVMYRDFFEFVGPGIVHLHALLWAVGGARLEVIGWSSVALGAALAATLYSLSARVTSTWLRFLPPLTFAALVYGRQIMADHKWPALLAGLLAVRLLCPTASARRAAAAGLLLGAAVLFTQDIGVGLLAGAVVAMLALGNARAAAALPAGAALAVGAGLAPLVWAAGADRVAYDLVTFPLLEYRRVNPARFRLPLLDLRAAAQLSCGVPALAAAAWAVRADPGLRLTSLCGMGLLLALAHRGLDAASLAFAAVVLTVPLAAALARLREQRGWRWPASGAAAALAGLSLMVALGDVGAVQSLRGWLHRRHRGASLWAARPAPELDWLQREAGPGEKVFVLPVGGGAYFLSGTRNATSFPYLLDQATPAQVEQLLRELRAAAPRVGLWNEAQTFWIPGSPVRAALRAGVLELYEGEALPSGLLLLRRKAAPAR